MRFLVDQGMSCVLRCQVHLHLFQLSVICIHSGPHVRQEHWNNWCYALV
jgi:hypothetical protein